MAVTKETIITNLGALLDKHLLKNSDIELSTTSKNPVRNKVITTELNKKADANSLAKVATTGNYIDLANKPTLSKVATSGSYNDLTDKPTIQSLEWSNITSKPTTVDGYGITDAVKSDSLATVATSGSYNDLSDKPTIPSAVTVDSALSTTSTNPVQNKVVKTALDGKQASGNYVTYTANSGVSFGAKTNQTTYCYDQSPMVVSNGIIIGGTAAEAGLVTRGICGVTPPNATDGTCTKENLYINYDQDETYGRYLVLGAGSAGDEITASTATSTVASAKMGKTRSAIRGDQMVNYVTAKTSDFISSSALTSKTISLGTAVTSTATKFNGASNITIPITGLNEAYLEWGGKNRGESFGPVDACLVPCLGANRFAFAPPEAVTIEYSRDGGTTWADYEASDIDDIKRNIFTTRNKDIRIGCATSGITTDYQVRVTINTKTANVYTVLQKFVIYINTRGATGCWCDIDAATNGDPTNFIKMQSRAAISGQTGFNVINKLIVTYGNTSSQYQFLRFTFGISGVSTTQDSSLAIYSIYGYGGMGWYTPSNLAKEGLLYSFDASQNATFPNSLTAVKLVKKGGTSSQFLKADGSVDSNTYLTSHQSLTAYAKTADLATVATSGSYNDLTDKPLNTSTSIEVENFTVTDASVIPTFSMTDVVAVVVFVNNVLAKDGESYGITGGTTLTFSQTMPVGTEITIYKFVSVGSVIPTPSYSIDSALSDTSTNAVQNKVVKSAIESKADEATVNALISETVTPLQTSFNSLQTSIDTAYAKYIAELG